MSEYLCRSLYVYDHPIYLEKIAYRENYCRTLSYFVNKYLDDSGSLAILDNFCHALLRNHYNNALITTPLTDQEIEYSLEKVAYSANAATKPAYRLAFLLDCCFICAFDDENKARAIRHDLKSLFTDKYSQKRSEHLLSALYHGAKVKKPKTRNDLYKEITCCKEQKDFFTWLPKTFLVTAYHKGAGKATLINAITGKKLLHPELTQEYGSGHINLLHSKAIEDRKISIQRLCLIQDCCLEPSLNGPNATPRPNHNAALSLNPSAAPNDIAAPAPTALPLTYYNFYDKEDVEHAWDVIAKLDSDCQIGLKYHNLLEVKNRLCVIDTPTINAAQTNAAISKKVIKDYAYDSLIYVLNAKQWGSDEECAYLQYLAQNVPQEKIVFVLNKIDLCQGDNGTTNSIANTINGNSNNTINGTIEAVKAKLSILGYTTIQIYPIC